VQDKVLTIGRTVFIELSTCHIVHFPWTWNWEALQHPAYYVWTRVRAIEPVCLTPGQRLSLDSWTLSAGSYWQTNTNIYEYKYRSSITTVPERPHWVWAEEWVSSASNGSAQTRPKLDFFWVLSPSAGAPNLCNVDDVSVKDPHREVLLPGRIGNIHLERIVVFVPYWIIHIRYGRMGVVH